MAAWARAMEIFAGADMILHAGDVLYHPPRMCCQADYDIPGLAELINASPIPVVIARGNCDAEVYEELLELPVQSPYAVVQSNDLRIVVLHGHGVSGSELRHIADKYHADIVVTGHTHIPVIERMGKCIHINPGSPSLTKFEVDGVPVPTVGLIEDGIVKVLKLDSGAELMSMEIVVST